MNGLCCTYIGMETKLQIGIWHPKARKGTKAGGASFGRVTSNFFVRMTTYIDGASKYDRLIQTPKKTNRAVFFANAYEYQMKILNCFFLQHKNHKQVQKVVAVLLGCFVSWKSIRFPSVTRAGISKTRRILDNKKAWNFLKWRILVEDLLMLRLDFLGLKDKSERRVSWVAERWVRVVSDLKD